MGLYFNYGFNRILIYSMLGLDMFYCNRFTQVLIHLIHNSFEGLRTLRTLMNEKIVKSWKVNKYTSIFYSNCFDWLKPIKISRFIESATKIKACDDILDKTNSHKIYLALLYHSFVWPDILFWENKISYSWSCCKRNPTFLL